MSAGFQPDGTPIGPNPGQTTPTTTTTPRPKGSLDYNTKLYTDPALQLATLLNILGLGSTNSRHSYGGATREQTYANLLPAWLKTQGFDGSNIMDNVYGKLQEFGNKVSAPGGFGALASDAGTGLQQFLGDPRNTEELDEKQIMALIKNFGEMSSLPLSPTMQQARGNAIDDSFFQFLTQWGDKAQQSDAAGDAFRYLPFLQNNPQTRWMLGR